MTEFETLLLSACFGTSVGTIVGNLIILVYSLTGIIKYCKNKHK